MINDVHVGSRHVALALLTAVALPFFAGCATARLASGWTSGQVAADGDPSDWTGQQPAYLVNDGLQLTVVNDTQRLCVMAKFRANDEQWARQAGMGGLTVRVTNPHRQTVSYRLPQGPERTRSDHHLEAEPDSGPGFGMMRQRMEQVRAQWQGRLLVTLSDKSQTDLPADGSQGPAAGFKTDNGMCVYEFSLPLSDTGRSGFSAVNARAGDRVRVTVSAGLSAEERAAFRDQMQSQSPHGWGGERPEGGGFGGPGGFGEGGRGGAHGTGRGPGQGMSSNPELSVTVQLAGAR